MRTGCQGDNGEQENSGSEDLSPFTHPSLEEPAVPHVITPDNGTGGSSVSVLQGEFVIPLSLKNDRSLLFSFFHSSAAMTPFRACMEQDVMEFFLFSDFTPYMVYIVHPSPGEYDQEPCDNL